MLLSPAELAMTQIKEKLKKSLTVPEHQNLFNLEHLDHVELRFPDGDLAPTSILARNGKAKHLVG